MISSGAITRILFTLRASPLEIMLTSSNQSALGLSNHFVACQASFDDVHSEVVGGLVAGGDQCPDAPSGSPG